jgi:hypothetical protein
VDEYESCEKGKGAPEDKTEEEDGCPICLEGCVSLDYG